MEVHIGELTSVVHAVDGDSVLTQQAMDRIIRTVMEAVRQREEHRERVRREQRISGGVRDEQEGEGW